MNFLELQQQLRKRLARDDQDSALPGWINLGIRSICDEYVFSCWQSKLSITVTGAESYELGDYRTIYSVRHVESSTVTDLEYVHIDSFDQRYPEAEYSPQTGTPECFTIWRKSIYPYPIPQSGALKIRCALYPPDLVYDSDVPSLSYPALIIAAAHLIACVDLGYAQEIYQQALVEYERRKASAIAADANACKADKHTLGVFSPRQVDAVSDMLQRVNTGRWKT